MILFVCSIVASTVGYLRRRRMGQWIKNLTADACCDGKQLIFRRISTSSVQPWRNPRTHGIYGVRSSDESTSLLWSADDSEVLLSERRNQLEPSWWRIYDGLQPLDAASLAGIVYFTGISTLKESDQVHPETTESTSFKFDIETVCKALAWRTDGDQIAVLFGCSIDDFTDLCCNWIDGSVAFRGVFEIQQITTETLSLEFVQCLGFDVSSFCASTSTSQVSEKCNGVIVHGYGDIDSSTSKTQTVTTLSLSSSGCCSSVVGAATTTAASKGRNVGDKEENFGSDLSRSSVLCSLEQLCLSDILAAKDLCRSLGSFEGDLTPDSGGQSVYHTCNRDFIDSGFSQGKATALAVSTPSLAGERNVGYDEMEDPKQTSPAALGSLSVDVLNGVSDHLSISFDHLSPCHGFNDRLLDRRWYSTWHCGSIDSSTNGNVVTRQPTRHSVSRSSSGSKRPSAHTMSKKAVSTSDGLQAAAASRRWSLASLPQGRPRAFSYSASRFRSTPVIKPPNILIYCGGDDSVNDSFVRLATVIGTSVHPEKYIVYRLKRSRFLVDPWPNNSACVILAGTTDLDDRCWQRLFDYFKNGGKMLFVCENRLLANLNDIGSTKRRYDLLRLAFHLNQHSKNQKDFKDFLKRLSKELKKPSVNEHFNVLAADGRNRFTLSFVREESTPLILFMQNSQDNAVALFSDATVDAILTAGRSLIFDILERLGLELAEAALPVLSSGYLIFENEESRREMATSFLSLGRIDEGKLSIEFFDRTIVPIDRVAPSHSYLPVWVNCDRQEHDFDEEDYFKHLKSQHLGRCVLYVPVATSTMNYFEGLLAKLPDKIDVVAIPKYQLEGQGRGGNRFLSPDGCAMFTIGLRLPLHCRLAESPGYVQHLLALAAVDSICSYKDELSTLCLRLKWPNDIYYGVGRLVKIGGVLVNCLARSDTLYFVAGLGLNVSNTSPTLCINDLLPPDVPAFRTEQVIALTLTKLEMLMDLFEKRGHDGILQLYYKYWLHNYQEFTLADGRERVIVRGLDKRGYLEVRSRQTGRVFSLQPDGNTLDMMHNLIKIKE